MHGHCAERRTPHFLAGYIRNGDLTWSDLRKSAQEFEALPANLFDAAKDPSFKAYASRRASEIVPKHVPWLWKNRIPRSMLSIIGGMPGLGKSQFTFAVIAAITTGGLLPDGTRAELGSVVMVNAEDHPDYTLIPRLIAAGADLTRVHLLEGCYDPETPKEKRAFDLSRVPDLVKLMDDIGDVALVTIDPIMSYMAGADSHKDAEVRASLLSLDRAAQHHNAAILLVTHLNKGSGGVLDRFMGSRAFTGLVRSAWVILLDPDDETETRCIFSFAKSNVGPPVQGIAYRVASITLPNGIEAQRLEFETVLVSRKASELLDAAKETPEERSEIDKACELWRDILKDGPVLTKVAEKIGKDAGFSAATLRRARERVGVRWDKAPGTGQVVLSLPKSPHEEFEPIPPGLLKPNLLT